MRGRVSSAYAVIVLTADIKSYVVDASGAVGLKIGRNLPTVDQTTWNMWYVTAM